MSEKRVKPTSDSCKALFTLMISGGCDELQDELIAQAELDGCCVERQSSDDREGLPCH